MDNRWDPTVAAQWEDDPLALTAYASRLLGEEPDLTLHGGGNASLKLSGPDLLQRPEEFLYVKASGRDMAGLAVADFTPLRLPPLREAVTRLAEFPDRLMKEVLLSLRARPDAPAPSVETFLHAALPHPCILHTHPDALLAIMNTALGESRVRSVFGPAVVVVPYLRPGFGLAKACARIMAERGDEETLGLALMNHGLVTFGATPREAYTRMIRLVNLAEDYLIARRAWTLRDTPQPADQAPRRVALATLRGAISRVAGRPMVLSRHDNRDIHAFVNRADLATIACRGPMTPDHVIRTRHIPLVGRDVDAYAAAYREAFEQYAPPGAQMLDPAPRVVLDGQLGLIAAGRDPSGAVVAADIARHTMTVIRRAEALGGYQPLGPEEAFAIEYWAPELAKLGGEDPTRPFRGEVALVTGAASGIGAACVASLLARGAAVVGLDLNKAIIDLHDTPNYYGIICDVTRESAIQAVLEETVRHFGGLDMLILNAGMFPPGQRIAELETDLWRKVMAVNLDANLILLREAHPLLALAPNGGRVVVIGSKNVPAPGPGAVAYSASKAALNQMARVAALEWGKDNIRINSLHPNAVFDTAIWTPEVLENRAKNYGLTVAEYKTNNLLRTEVTSHDVAELAAAMCGPLFAKTTAAQVPVDGGNERVV